MPHAGTGAEVDLGDRQTHALCDEAGKFHVFARSEDGELLSADTAGYVVLSCRLQDCLRDQLQGLIAGMVAIGVVDRLETVDINHQHCPWRFLFLNPSDACQEGVTV